MQLFCVQMQETFLFLPTSPFPTIRNVLLYLLYTGAQPSSRPAPWGLSPLNVQKEIFLFPEEESWSPQGHPAGTAGVEGHASLCLRSGFILMLGNGRWKGRV